MTTEYQQAVLQAMSIPLFVRTLEAQSAEEPSIDEKKTAAETQTKQEAERVDENSPFVQKVLEAIGFDSLQDANLQWLIEDAPRIVLSDNVLVTPQLKHVQSPAMKKSLWLAIQHLQRDVK
jgi:predicted dinucleotide-utilizing enzyme